MKRLIFLFLSLFFFCAQTAFPKELSLPAELPTNKEVLDNGFVCIVRDYPGTGLVSVNVTLNSGSSTEGKFLGSGASHLMEHMVFKSTKKYKLGEIEKIVRSIGGSMNAATSLDTTSFFITAPSDNFATILDVLKQMLFNADFPEAEFEGEKKVILKEMLLHDDDPSSKLDKLLWRTAYLVSPYRHPVIGYIELFKALKNTQVLEFYQKKFVPNNMVMAIAGDVRPEVAFKLVKENFSDVRLPDYYEVAFPKEPEQLSPRSLSDRAQVNLAYIALAFPSTSIFSNDMYALDLLAVILGQGDASRLNKKLVKELQLVQSVTAFNYTPKHKGLFIMESVLEPDNIGKVKEIILKELEAIKKLPPESQELERAKNLITSSYIYDQQSLEAVAANLSLNQTVTGDFDFFREYVKMINKVMPADISSVARKYFDNQKINFVQLLPKGYKEKTENESVNLILPGINSTKSALLDNGIKIQATRSSKTPSVFITVAFLAGLRLEPGQDNGISNISAAMLLKGTTTRNESQIKSAFEVKGAEINSFSGQDTCGLTVRILKDDFDFAVSMLKDLLQNSTFPQEELEKLKNNTILSIQVEDDDIFKLGFDELKKLIYKNHPYSKNEIGTKESVAAFTRQKVMDFYEKFAVTSNMVISVCGDIDPDLAIAKLNQEFKGIKKSSNENILKHEEVPGLAKIEQKDIKMDRRQGLVLIGFRGIPISDKERFAFNVLTSIMSGASGRLFQSIRNTKDVSYAQGFYFRPAYDTGSFGLYVATSPENVKKAEQEAIRQINILAEKGVSQEEIIHAKGELIAKHRMGLEGSNEFVSMQEAVNELYGLGFKQLFEYEQNINNVTQDDVAAIIHRYISKSSYVVVTVTPEKNS